MYPNVVGVAAAREDWGQQAIGKRRTRRGSGRGKAYVRYETERKGFWLKTSLSKNLCKRSHDIGAGELSGSSSGSFVAERREGGVF